MPKLDSLSKLSTLDLDIFVVSRSRFTQSNTLDSLGDQAKLVRLVVPFKQKEQYKALAAQHGCTVVGCPYDGISLTRQYCGKISQQSKFLMLDDDLTFFRRVSATDYHLRYPVEVKDNVRTMLLDVATYLNHYAHVAISARQGNNRLDYPGVECSRPLRALAYQKEEFLKCIHGRVKIMEDFDITLQLLKRGHKNFVISKWSQDQIQTQMQGGCSDYRTKQLHEDNVKLFAEFNSPFVKLKQKKNKTGGEFGERLEAIIYWKKAYESSKN